MAFRHLPRPAATESIFVLQEMFFARIYNAEQR
jgi:hypothetical protein